MFAHGREDGGDDGYREDAVGQLEEHLGVLVGRHTPVYLDGQGEDEPRADLPQQDVSQQGNGQSPDLAYGGVLEVEHRLVAYPDAHQRGDLYECLGCHAYGGAYGQEDKVQVVVAGPWQEIEDHHRGDDHEVVGDGCEGRGLEMAVGVEQAAEDGAQPVEDDLRHEEAQQESGLVPHYLGGHIAGGVGAEERHQPDDEGTGHDAQGGHHPQEEDGYVGHRTGDVPCFLPRAGGQIFHEDGDEKRGDDAPQDEVVDHIGHGVGQVVGAGEVGLTETQGQTEHVGKGGVAQEPRHAADGRADGHHGGVFGKDG